MAIFLFFIFIFVILNKCFWDKVFKDENPEELEARIRILHYCFRN